jgi:transposase
MRFIEHLSPETQHLLRRISKQSQSHRVRQRAHCILLSFAGLTTTELMKVFDVERLTIYHWLNAWEERRFAGLYDGKGRGRPYKLTSEEQATVQQYVQEHPQDLKQVVYKIEQETTKKVSTKTIQRLLKKKDIAGSVYGKRPRNLRIHNGMSIVNS